MRYHPAMVFAIDSLAPEMRTDAWGLGAPKQAPRSKTIVLACGVGATL